LIICKVFLFLEYIFIIFASFTKIKKPGKAEKS